MKTPLMDDTQDAIENAIEDAIEYAMENETEDANEDAIKIFDFCLILKTKRFVCRS